MKEPEIQLQQDKCARKHQFTSHTAQWRQQRRQDVQLMAHKFKRGVAKWTRLGQMSASSGSGAPGNTEGMTMPPGGGGGGGRAPGGGV